MRTVRLTSVPAAGCFAPSVRSLAHKAPLRNIRSQQLHTALDQSSATYAEPEELVSLILRDISGTDGGITISAEKRVEVDANIRNLEGVGAGQEPRPLENPLIFGNYDVAYVSAGPSQDGAPAGGGFRGTLGRAAFMTNCVCQSILKPDIVINKVGFNLLGLSFLAGSIGLRGRLETVPDGGSDSVTVKFDPPQLSLAGIQLRIGPPSTVQIKTTYLDGRIRCGLGGRGSLFVFKRGGQSNNEEMDQVGLRRMTGSAKLLLASLLPWLALSCVVLWRSYGMNGRVACVVIAALQFAFAAVLLRGKIIDDAIHKEQQGVTA